MNEVPHRGLTTSARILAIDGEQQRETIDDLATEEPLEIRIGAAAPTSFAVTMRTPGHDFELTAGFLYSEGVVTERGQILELKYCVDPTLDETQRYNVVTALLDDAARDRAAHLVRHFTVSSACGVCGKGSIEELAARTGPLAPDTFRVPAATIAQLPEQMREAQRIFATTGGLHAAALFDERGELLALREDVGRHNAVDKIVGCALLGGRLPLDRCILLVSGRASFELAQKCVLARIPIMCSVSAPSSLAVDVARRFGLTLAGFVRGTRANVYSAAERITTFEATS